MTKELHVNKSAIRDFFIRAASGLQPGYADSPELVGYFPAATKSYAISPFFCDRDVPVRYETADINLLPEGGGYEWRKLNSIPLGAVFGRVDSNGERTEIRKISEDDFAVVGTFWKFGSVGGAFWVLNQAEAEDIIGHRCVDVTNYYPSWRVLPRVDPTGMPVGVPTEVEFYTDCVFNAFKVLTSQVTRTDAFTWEVRGDGAWRMVTR
jgi:hypothetical protein